MALVDQKKKKKKNQNQNRVMKNKGMQLPGTSSLASIESLAIPLVQEVVFLADFRCPNCQQRVAEAMAKMNGETDSVVVSVLEKKVLCMVMKINLDCNSCCRKMRRVLLRMKEIERHMIDKEHCRVVVCGRYVPADIAIKLRKKMNRRVEILEIQELVSNNNPNEQTEEIPQAAPDHTIAQPAA